MSALEEARAWLRGEIDRDPRELVKRLVAMADTKSMTIPASSSLDLQQCGRIRPDGLVELFHVGNVPKVERLAEALWDFRPDPFSTDSFADAHEDDQNDFREYAQNVLRQIADRRDQAGEEATAAKGNDGEVVLASACIHPRATLSIGPTTDQRNHHCPDCGAWWTAYPERAAAAPPLPTGRHDGWGVISTGEHYGMGDVPDGDLLTQVTVHPFVKTEADARRHFFSSGPVRSWKKAQQLGFRIVPVTVLYDAALRAITGDAKQENDRD